MTLKQRLDAVWDMNTIACPNNLVRWSEKYISYSKFAELNLYYTKGYLYAKKKIRKRQKINGIYYNALQYKDDPSYWWSKKK